MINLTNNLLKDKKKYFNNNKSLTVCVNYALLGFRLCQSVSLHDINITDLILHN